MTDLQDDIFPDAYAGKPSLSADEWFAGTNAPVSVHRVSKQPQCQCSHHLATHANLVARPQPGPHAVSYEILPSFFYSSLQPSKVSMDPAKNGGLTGSPAASFKPAPVPAPAPAPAASSPAGSSTSASSSAASAAAVEAATSRAVAAEAQVSSLEAKVASLTLELEEAKAKIAELEAKSGAVKATLEAAL